MSMQPWAFFREAGEATDGSDRAMVEVSGLDRSSSIRIDATACPCTAFATKPILPAYGIRPGNLRRQRAPMKGSRS